MCILFRKLLIGCFTILAWLCCEGQSCRDMQREAGSWGVHSDYRKALEAYREAKQCFLTQNDAYEYLNSLRYEMDCLMKLSEFQEAADQIRRHATEISRYQDRLNPDQFNSLRFSNQLFSALLKWQSGDVDGAILLLESQLDSVSHAGRAGYTVNDSARVANLHLYLSELYLLQGNHGEAQTHASRAVHIGSRIRSFVTSGAILRPLLAIAESQFNAGHTDDMRKTLSYLNTMVETVAERRSERAFLVAQSLFNIYLRSGRPDSARSYLDQLKALDLEKQYYTEILRLTGDYYAAIAEYDRAENAYRQALTQLIQKQGAGTETCARIYFELGHLALKRDDFNQAIEFFHQGIYTLSGSHASVPGVAENPPLELLFAQTLTLEALAGKTEAFLGLYRSTGAEASLDHAWHVSKLTIRFLSSLRSGYFEESDKSRLIDASYSVFEQALKIVNTYYTLTDNQNWLDTAFVLMEESKALNLREAVFHGQARRFAGIPDSLLRLENALRLQIAGKEKLIREYRSSPHYDPSIEFRYRNELIEVQSDFRRLRDRYEREFPRYFTLKHNTATASPEAFRSVLTDDQVMLEYFVGDSSVFLLAATCDGQEFYDLGSAAILTRYVQQYRKALFDFTETKSQEALLMYANAAVALHQILIPAKYDSQKAFLIIPDGILGYVSFAGLIRTMPGRITHIPDYDFLLWHHEIAYSYSANLYLELVDVGQHKPGQILVCAPEFHNLHDIRDLRFNKEEARLVRDITHGYLLSGPDCTLDQFKHTLSNLNLSAIHFATHGSANDTEGDSSFLVFSGNGDSAYLYVHDLYNMELQMPLVYLSACETGTGEVRRGEGMISLARGFFYAGVSGLVTTLWRLEDRRALQLSSAFYQNIMSGMRKDVALAEAQRRYVKTLSPKDRLYAHPVYWSAIIPVGNMEAVIFRRSAKMPWWPAGFIGIGLFTAGFLLVMRKRRKTRRDVWADHQSRAM